jgi:hypothetical protein
MTGVLGKRLRYIEKTVTAISVSPAVERFIIGITARPTKRPGEYRAVGIPHFVILATGFTRRKALEIEGLLQMRLNTHLKYHPEKKSKKPSKSWGGSKRNKENSAYSVYMAWK